MIEFNSIRIDFSVMMSCFVLGNVSFSKQFQIRIRNGIQTGTCTTSCQRTRRLVTESIRLSDRNLIRNCNETSNIDEKPSETPIGIENESFSTTENVSKLRNVQSDSHTEPIETNSANKLVPQFVVRALALVLLLIAGELFFSSVTLPRSMEYLPFGDGTFNWKDIVGLSAFMLLVKPTLMLIWTGLRSLKLVKGVEFKKSFVAKVHSNLLWMSWIFAGLVGFDVAKTIARGGNPLFKVILSIDPFRVKGCALILYLGVLLNTVKALTLRMIVSPGVKSENERGTRGEFVFLDKSLSVLLSFTVVSALALTAGIPLHTITAFGGISSLAIGFASKEVIKDLYAGFMIYAFKPFLQGDEIMLPGFNSNGRLVVEHIGWMHSTLRMWDSNPVIVPNAELFGEKVINRSLKHHGYVSEVVHIRFRDLSKLQLMLDGMTEYLCSQSNVNTTKYAPLVYVERLEMSSIVVRISVWTKEMKSRQVKVAGSRLMIGLAQVIRSFGCEFAFPHLELETQSPLVMQQTPTLPPITS